MQILLGFRYSVSSHCFLGSNVPLILLISPCKFQELAKKGQNPLTKKNEVHFGHNLAKISYMRVNVKLVRTDVLEGWFLQYWIGIKSSWPYGALPLESLRFDQPLPSNLLKTDFPLKRLPNPSDKGDAIWYPNWQKKKQRLFFCPQSISGGGLF